MGLYDAGDELAIGVSSTGSVGVVRYYRNGVAVYTSTVTAPSAPLYMDSSLYSTGSKVQNAYICNGVPGGTVVGDRPVERSFGAAGPDCSPCNQEPQANASVADPVNAATGNAYWPETDLHVTSPGLPFAWNRTYNSRDSRLGILGRGWSSSYDARLDLSVAGQVTFISEGGAQAIYLPDGTGNQYLPPAGVISTLQRNADHTYTLVRPDQHTLRFSSAGQLLSSSDSAGRTINLSYANGKLSSITDTAGRTYALTTDSQGRATQLTDTSITSAQRAVVYSYTGSLLTEVQDLLGNTTYYSYTNNLLTAVVLADGSTRVENRYDTEGRVVWQDAWETLPVTITYDLPAPPVVVPGQTLLRTTVQDSSGRTSSYDHDIADRLIRMTDPAGHVTLYTLDANDRPTQSRDPLGHSTNSTYDTRGNLLTVQDATNRASSYTYDSANRLKTQTDGLGRTSTYTYTAEGLLKQSTNALGNTTAYTYTVVPLRSGGSTPLLTSTRDALGRVTQFAYNDLGQATVITNALNQATSMEYDGAGRLLRTIDPAGIATCNEYNAADQLTASVQNCVAGQSSTISRNVRTEYGYDLLGRGTWTRNSLGEVTRTFYNDKGSVGKVVVGCAVNGTASTTTCDAYDPAHPHLNRTTTYGYDDLGREVSATDTLGVVSRTEYDTQDRPTAYTLNYLPGQPADPVTNVTSTTEYDAAGRVSASVDPLGRRSVPHYDNVGRVIEQITNYADGSPSTGTADTDLVSRIDYDVVGLPVTTTLNYVDGVWDSAHPDEDVRTVTRYDELGRPSKLIENYVDGVSSTHEVDTDRITEYHYDAVGNLVATIDPLGRIDVTIYDALDRPTTQIRNCTDSNGQPSTSSTSCAAGHGTNNDENIRTSTTYDARGLVEINRDALDRVVHTAYDALGRVTEYVLNESGSYVPTNMQYQYGYAYTTLGYTVMITNPLQGVTKSEYNRAGWLVKQTDATNRAVTYSYDGLGRVVASTDALRHQTRTIYDALGRETKDVANWHNGTVETADGTDRDLITQV